ncbi:12912_t:CDS:2, partial [Dentiscutata erythropus]
AKIDADPNLKSANVRFLSKFNPIIKEFFDAYKENKDIYIIAEHYKQTCDALLDRVEKAEEVIQESLKQDNNLTFFKRNFIAFREFVNTVKLIRNFTSEISQITGLQKHLHSGTVDQNFQKLKFAFDRHMKDFNFSISNENQFQTEKDNEALKKDTESFKKIAYFGLSREFVDATRTVNLSFQNIRYIASERLLDFKHKYDIKCEVYSFGMLLWEIAELKLLYEDEMNISKICEKITKEQYCEKFSNACHQNPECRPFFANIFLTIQELSEQKFNLLNTSVNPTDELHNQESETFLNFDELGLLETEREVHKKQAAQLFKEAADDDDMVDAQLKFEDCIFNSVGANKDVTKAVEYYRKAADNNNPIAIYKIGNIYYHGDGVKKDLAIGEKFLRLAAYNQQEQAIEI